MAESRITQPATVPGAAVPTAAHERIAVLDILRGFALFGILSVNMAFFSMPIHGILAGLEPWTEAADRAAAWLIRFLAEGKFYSLFSFLFGLGLTIQMARAEARGIAFVPLYIRRLVVLLLIGLAHAYLIWIGDILVMYALLGSVLLLFRKRALRTLLIWAVIFLSVPLLLTLVGTILLELGRRVPEAAVEIDRSFAASMADFAAQAERASRVYAEGNFVEVTIQRARDLNFFYPFSFFIAPNILAMFLLGLYAGKRGLFQHIEANLPFIRRITWWGLGLGLSLNLIFAIASEVSSRVIPTPIEAAGIVAQGIGAPMLALGYAAGITLLVRGSAWRQRLAPLAAVGRMALSNYLFQSLVCTTIFYGYGLGLFGQVGPAAGLLLTVGIYLIQIPLSVWWLRHFRFGPAEWLWRSLTYGRRQPMRELPTTVA